MTSQVNCVYTIPQKTLTAALLQALVAAAAVPEWIQEFGCWVISDVTVAGPPVVRTIQVGFLPTVLPSVSANLIIDDAQGEGPVGSFNLINPGLDFIRPPIISFVGGNPTRGAIARATLDVSALVIDAGGSGFTSPPRVVFTGGLPTDGSGVLPTAHTTIGGGGNIATLVLDTPGSGLIGPPAISFVGGGPGVGEAAHARMQIDAVHLIDGGQGYTAAPAVVLTAVLNEYFPLDADKVKLFTNMMNGAIKATALTPVPVSIPTTS